MVLRRWRDCATAEQVTVVVFQTSIPPPAPTVRNAYGRSDRPHAAATASGSHTYHPRVHIIENGRRPFGDRPSQNADSDVSKNYTEVPVSACRHEKVPLSHVECFPL